MTRPARSWTTAGARPTKETMHDKDIEAVRSAISALEGQRATLGDAVLELALAPLRARLASLQRPVGLQRRQVTVLFADVVGSTAMAQNLDAEDTLAVLSGAMQRMAAVVEAHRGRVLRFTGDGVKAAFGMDEAREDDAERAVRAGLAILEAGRAQAGEAQRLHGVADFALRVGVHTGDVALGAGVDADNTAIGAAVNIAARMEQTAPPGALRISHDTWSQVRGLFELEPQPPLQVKGIDASMVTYLVRAARERSVASVERGLQGLATPMVGRDAELQRLLGAVGRARETRQLQAVTLIGDAGLGKSRLLREFSAQLTDCRVLTLRSQPDGQLRLWGLLRSLLALQCGVADTDSADVARRKVVDALSPCFDERGERQAQLVGQLAGLDFGDSPHVRGLDPRSLRDQAFTALRGYLQALAASGPLPVLIVEDLHWADDGSLDLLQHLLAHAAELPLALIMTGRPALLARRPDWAAPEALVQLGPLAATHSDELARALLRRIDVVPAQLSELIVGRAEGNPYYMEELVRRLIDDGVIVVGEPHWTVRVEQLDTARLPGTLVGLLQARLDTLPAAERQAARQASIIGHVFWDDALQALDTQAPQALPALERAAFVRDHDTSDFEGTPERQFDHHLLHQVTYDTLLKAERKLGHGAAARWLQARTQGRGAEFLAMTGEHAERAGETALAIDCFEQAGQEAQKRFANAAATAWLQRALGLLGESEPGRRVDLLHRLQVIADTMGDRAAQDARLEQAAAVLEAHPDEARQARLWYARALLADRRTDRAESMRMALHACELAERCAAPEPAAMSHGLLVWLNWVLYEIDAARAHLERSLQWARRIEAEDLRLSAEAKLLTLSAMVSMRQCRYAEAKETLLDVLARAELMGAPNVQLGALDNLALCDSYRGRWEDVRRWGEGMLDVARWSGNQSWTLQAQWRVSRAAEGLDDIDAALRWCEVMLPLARTIGNRSTEAATLRVLADGRRSQGDTAAGLALYRESQAVFRAIGDEHMACELEGLIAQCELALGGPDAALSKVNALLVALGGDLSKVRTADTICLRAACQQVLEQLGDARAGPLLQTLYDDVHAEVANLTEPADRDRLIASVSAYRDVVAAYGRMHGGATTRA